MTVVRNGSEELRLRHRLLKLQLFLAVLSSNMYVQISVVLYKMLEECKLFELKSCGPRAFCSCLKGKALIALVVRIPG